MNLIYMAKNGMHAAQSALNVVMNNTSNSSVPEYHRQDIVFGESGGKTTPYGFFGYGVQVDTVQRANDNYLNHRVRDAESEVGAIRGRLQQMSQIDRLFADDTQNIASEFSKIFVALQRMSNDPVSLPPREEALAQFHALCDTFHRNSKTLDSVLHESHGKLRQVVDEINSISQQIVTLNVEIEKVYANTRSLPANLLDKRDALLDKLSGQAGLRVNENAVTGRMSITLNNGLTLVNRDSYNRLTMVPAADNPERFEIHHLDSADNRIPLTAENIVTGELAGLLKFCHQDLPSVSCSVNQQALSVAHEFNTVNKQGFTSDGQQGGPIFDYPQPVALTNANNISQAKLDVSYENIRDVTSLEYELTYINSDENPAWQIKTSDGVVIDAHIQAGGELLFDGLKVSPVGIAQTGDKFRINPLAGVAKNITVAITDCRGIAASSSENIEEQSNNENVRELLSLKEKKIISGSTLSDNYNSLVGMTGTKTHQLVMSEHTRKSVCESLSKQQQSVVGVNINEEYVSIMMFTQYYQANAQVLKSAITLFDTLLSIR